MERETEAVNIRKKKRCAGERDGNFIDTLSRNFDIPADAVSGFAHIEMNGNREIDVDGCLGVLEYGENTIVLNTSRVTVKICGYELTVVSMQNGRANIKGLITCVDFCTGEAIC